MKITQILLKQHIGHHFNKHWWLQSKKRIIQTESAAILKKKGIEIHRPDDILKDQIPPEKVEIVGIKPDPIKFDKTHPHWNDRICHLFRDENVLLAGLNQARILTNSVVIKEGLPDSIDVDLSTKEINKKVKEFIFNSHLFDAEQEKLPKIKDPLRPAFNFPRSYGITDVRRNTLIISRLLQLIELSGELDNVRSKAIFNDLYFSYPFERNGDLIQFELRGDTLITSNEPLKSVHDSETNSIALPNINPIKETITLVKENIYQTRNCYPIDLSIGKSHPHTLFVHYNGTEVKNLFEEPITETQIEGRTLLKTFTVAASYAKQLYGEEIKELPKPVVLQCVHTEDGRLFHFGVLQLNTLDLISASTKNVWYQTKRLPLFENCSYVLGKPVLQGYNDKVIKHLIGFYNNI